MITDRIGRDKALGKQGFAHRTLFNVKFEVMSPENGF